LLWDLGPDISKLTSLKDKAFIYTDFIEELNKQDFTGEGGKKILEKAVFYNEYNFDSPLREYNIPKSISICYISLPVIWVTIRAMPYNKDGNALLADPVVKHQKIEPAFNYINIDLGEEQLDVWTIDDIIALFPQIASSAIVQPTPVPELGGETEIIARLVLGSPDIPPQPTMTPFGGSEVSGSNLEAQGEVGLENYQVKLTIVEGVGELIPAAGGTLEGDTVVTYTDNYGYCNAILKTNRPGTIKIKAECDLLATATTLSTSG